MSLHNNRKGTLHTSLNARVAHPPCTRARYPTRAISISLTGTIAVRQSGGSFSRRGGSKRVPPPARSYAENCSIHITGLHARGHSQLTETNPRSCMHKVLSCWKFMKMHVIFSKLLSDTLSLPSRLISFYECSMKNLLN